MANSEKYIPVFRHGEFDGPGARSRNYRNFVGSISEESREYPLTEKGKAQIRESVRKLPNYHQIDLLVASQFSRTQQSAEVISSVVNQDTGRKIEVFVSPLLNPVWMPSDSLSEEEYEKLLETGEKNAVADIMFSKWADGKIGETPELVMERIESFITYLRKTIDNNLFLQLAIVTHASFASAMQRYVQRISLASPRNEEQILKVAGYYFLAVGREVEQTNLDLVMFREQYIADQRPTRTSLAHL